MIITLKYLCSYALYMHNKRLHLYSYIYQSLNIVNSHGLCMQCPEKFHIANMMGFCKSSKPVSGQFAWDRRLQTESINSLRQ